jgi:hypothetical protein
MRHCSNSLRPIVLAAGVLLAAASGIAACAQSDPGIGALIDRLDATRKAELQEYRLALQRFEAEAALYWQAVADTRTERRRKLRAKLPITLEDYVMQYPPQYQGPQPSKEVLAVLAEEQQRDPPRPVLTVQDALREAEALYGFRPWRISEIEFKRRYAAEALDLGLTKDQVLRVYALETGGMGTADMQAGINPITKQGKAISTALGYAQLLHANSVSELVKSGDRFIARLLAMAADPAQGRERAAELRAKADVLRRMLARARTVPNEWSAHVKFAGTPDGIGIHALNLDGDIGPWLQVIKLAGLRTLAAEEGRTQLTGAEIELMNLAGPATGLEMLSQLATGVPTPNFFSRGGYERNSVVRGRTARELLLELDKRMEGHMSKPGTVEFAQAFDDVAAARAGGRAPAGPGSVKAGQLLAPPNR